MIQPTRRDFLKTAVATYASTAFGTPAQRGGTSNQKPDDLAALSLRDASELLARARPRLWSLQRVPGRIERLNPALNAFITVTAEQALVDARAAESEIARGRMRGPLHGIPIALKDLFDTAGVRTTAASAVFADRIPSQDAKLSAASDRLAPCCSAN